MVYILALVIPFLVFLLVFGFLNWLGRKLGWVYKPKPPRMDKRALPYIGGIGLWLVVLLSYQWTSAAFLIGVSAAFLFGFLDDICDLSVVRKLLTQIIVALLYFAFLYPVFNLNMNFFQLALGVILFLLCFNAANFMDIADGLLAGVFAILSTGLYIKTFGFEAFGIWIVFIAGLLAFLRWNLPPAKIVLGNSGSQLLGFIYGYMCISNIESPKCNYLVLILISIPFILDICFTVIRRCVKKVPIYRASNDHLFLWLISKGLKQWHVLGMWYGFAILCSGVVFFIK